MQMFEGGIIFHNLELMNREYKLANCFENHTSRFSVCLGASEILAEFFL